MPLVIKKYNCSQQSLYAVCRSGWSSCSTYLSLFNAFSPLYTGAFVTAKVADINTAETLPDAEQRTEDSRTLRVNLKNKATECMDLWQRLKRYITKAYPADQVEIKLDAAGQSHYRKAGQDDWGAVSRLLVDGDAFITANTADLTAGNNMPAAFAATFNTAKTQYDTFYQSFITAGQSDEVETQTKLNANNAIHADLMAMFLDGQEIFKNDEAVRKLFIFDQVLLNVEGPGIAGAKGEITNSTNDNPITTAANLEFVGPTEYTTVSGPDSRYQASPLAAGSYTVTVTCPGFQTLIINNVEIQTGVLKTLNIELTPAP